MNETLNNLSTLPKSVALRRAISSTPPPPPPRRPLATSKDICDYHRVGAKGIAPARGKGCYQTSIMQRTAPSHALPNRGGSWQKCQHWEVENPLDNCPASLFKEETSVVLAQELKHEVGFLEDGFRSITL